MSWGIQTWNANGIPNNYGLKPVSVAGRIPLAAGQTSGSWSFTVPSGFKVGFVVSLDAGGPVLAGGSLQTETPFH